MNRPANNRLEIDVLPPYGEDEVSMVGDVALVGGVIIALGVVLAFLKQS